MVKKLIREHTDAHMTTRVLVRDIMNSPVVSASPNDTIHDIAKKMKDENIGSIIIMEKDKPVGIVTDWDIVSKAIVNDAKPSQIKAKEVMKEIYTIESEESITEAAACSGNTTLSVLEWSTRTDLLVLFPLQTSLQ